ncbi:multicopper oxidase domain-containing protein [Shewanella sp. D64]|uniref:multicopper oxidase domain-containing protein n=1 Tax=unclassified Shewanella TaxID=196818 RepID=UPI0022BA1FF7|nr:MULTISPECIES: multicopper oxidase domain-containing protein [unclassified Shewanella]MEC4727097.1 multicopper oxidase domain-containing protein [Shewanella sp. D64]MEC4737836.1 multicopper oxidase domain-containing protein [Shewanella sp. E94]WBJ93908.1 multicopper oxidase domain-containing protein [Shewanella sp. MTB7]
MRINLTASKVWILSSLLLIFSQIVNAETLEFSMTIEEMVKEVTPGFSNKVWAFNGQVPGPLIRAKEGDRLKITVQNNSTLAHTVHWHGTFQTNSWKMDGVPGVTQEAIEPGDSFLYDFIVDRPGSLWYHCHVNVPEHVGLRGMWGPMIIDPKDPTDIEKEITKEAIMMFSGWNSEVAMEYGKGGHPQELNDYFSINGKSFPSTQPLRVKKGEVLRIRLYAATVEAAYHLHGHDVLVTHKDGLPLDSPYWADVVYVPSGGRVDVIVRMDNPGIWINHDHIERHTSNAGKMPGGAVTIIEYEGVETEDWYKWKDKVYQADFYMSETMEKGSGIHNIDIFKATPPKSERSNKKRKRKKSANEKEGS